MKKIILLSVLLIVCCHSYGKNHTLSFHDPKSNTIKELDSDKETKPVFILNDLTVKSLDKPPFKATYAETATPAQNISLKQISVKENQITNIDDWFTENNLHFSRMETKDGFSFSPKEAPLNVADNIPEKWDNLVLVDGFSREHANFYLYGESRLTRQYMLITDTENKNILHALDFGEYIYPSESSTNGFIDMRVKWADIKDNILYVSTGHNTYAKSSNGINAFITAIDLSTYKIRWQSEALVSNAANFEIIGDNIVCGYGFTDEPDFLYVLDRFTGKKIQTLKLATGPDYIIAKGDKLYVRTYNRDYVFMIHGLK